MCVCVCVCSSTAHVAVCMMLHFIIALGAFAFELANTMFNITLALIPRTFDVHLFRVILAVLPLQHSPIRVLLYMLVRAQ